MNLTRIGFAALLSICVTGLSPAQEQPQAPAVHRSDGAGASDEGPGLLVNPTRKAAKAAEEAAGNSEVFDRIIIGAGKTVTLNSTLDYTSAGSVAITVQCIVCTSQASSLAKAGLILQARWSVKDSEGYVSTENKLATSFPYWDSGGALFSTYGSSFRLALQNKGEGTIAIEQITFFRRQ